MPGQRPPKAVPIDMNARWGPRLRQITCGLFCLLAVGPARVSPKDPEPTSLSPATLRACAPEASRQLPGQRSARVLLGLSAYACGDAAGAVTLLSAVPRSPDAPRSEESFEDWRLFALAAAAFESGDLALATAAADTLLLDHPESPLRHRSFALRAQIALQAGELDRALSMARASRAASFPEPLRTELDVLAWEAATKLERSIDVRLEASQLLLRSPVEALELNVAETLRSPQGAISWTDHFRSWELLQRADRLLEVGLVGEALETLIAVPASEKGFDWQLLNARALIEDKRGVEALDTLGDADPPDPSSQLELAWLRAEAALDAATARRGRRNLPSDEREAMRRSAQVELRQIVQRGGDSGRAVDALGRLFEELADGAHFEDVMEILERLRTLDPDDTRGARYLWRLGWRQYSQRNYSGAIGYWSELLGLYPSSKLARAAHYWSARAHESLGNGTRAQTLFEEVAAAPATDFYRKHALIRLGREIEPPVELPEIARQPWPSDPLLARAEQLSDLGIDRLGLEEVELLGSIAERRAVAALRSRILARQGRRRESIQSLWPVFPTLGTSDQVVVPGEALRMYYPVEFLSIVERFAADNQLPVTLLLAMIRQESAFDVEARSWAGARGLMQVMPATARELAQRLGLPYSKERLNDPSYSVQLGSRYFRQVLDMFEGNVELALAGYNAGPYRIRKLVRNAGSNLEVDTFLEGLKIEESKTYVKRVVLFSNSYQQLYPGLG